MPFDEFSRENYLEKPLPSNPDAERIILGAALLDNRVLPQAIEHLKPENFYSPLYRRIFRAMITLFEGSERIDPILIGEELKKDSSLESIGGIAAITNLTYGLPHFSDIADYVKTVREKSRIRALINACGHISASALAEDDLPEAILSFAQSTINEVCVSESKRSFAPIGDLSAAACVRVSELAKNGGTQTGLRTGFRDLDKITGGLQKTDLIIIAGRPGQGKSSIVGNIAERISFLEKEPVIGIFSLEMSKEQYTDRILCSKAEIDLSRYRTGYLTKEEFDRLFFYQNELDDSKIFIDDSSSLTPLEMRSKLMQLKARHKKLDLVIVDYLQRMAGSRWTESRQQEVSSIARELKSIAKDFEVPLIAVSSLSRECEKRNPPRPRMSDLRESGDIESEADLVAFVYRPEYYSQTEENMGYAELIIDKHRHGATDTVKLAFMKEYTKFANYYG